MSETPGWSSPDQPNQPPQQPQQPQPGQYPQYQGQPYQPPAPVPTVKPGVIPLRPLGLGEILDGAITTMRKHPMIIAAAAIVAVITQVVGLIVTIPFITDAAEIANNAGSMTEQELNDSAVGVLVSGLIGGGTSILLTLIGTVFLSGFVTVVVGHAVLGKPVTVGQAWQEFRPRLLPLLGATLLLGLILTIGLLLCILPGVWLWVLFGLVTPALVLERAGVFDSFSRSMKLIKDAWWRTFGILLLTVVITIVIGYIIQLPFELGAQAMYGVNPTPEDILSPVSLILLAVGGIISSTITLPFSSAVTVLVYVDRRMRAEGMDIELQRAAGHGV